MASPAGYIPPLSLTSPPTWAPEPDLGDEIAEGVTIDLGEDALEDAENYDPETHSIAIEQDDGGVTIKFGANPDDDDDFEGDDKFYENLADKVEPWVLMQISSDLEQGIESDDDSRSMWKQTRVAGYDLLGLEINTPTGDVTTSSAPLEGMSTVRHPLLLEAVLRFQANAYNELLPPGGPARIRNDGDENVETDDTAAAFEKEFNSYLTTRAPEYYPDTDAALFKVGFGGCAFKKIYKCPIRRRPVSETVDPDDMIVSDDATDIQSAARVTHRIKMRPSILKRMQIIGAYRRVDLGIPYDDDDDPVSDKKHEIEGISPSNMRPEDAEYTVYECYCELDIEGFEHEQDGEKTGLPLPYKVTMERDSGEILEIRRNWIDGDEMYMPRRPFVKYPCIRAFGFYDIGFVHILGNTTMALTAAWRLGLDAGMFANFPGFLYAADQMIAKQKTNQFRIPPGGGVGINIGDRPIGDVVMKLPYTSPDAGFQQFLQGIQDVGERLGGTATTASDMNAEIPVGTMMAMIDEAGRVQSRVHAVLTHAQAEELQMLVDLFREDPEALWRGNPNPEFEWTKELARQALEKYTLVPVAEPQTPSQTHRIMKAQGLRQASLERPELYDANVVETEYLKVLGFSNPEKYFAPPPEEGAEDPIADPAAAGAVENERQRIMLDARIEELKLQIELMKLKADYELKTADRQSKEMIAATKEETARMKMAAEDARTREQAAQNAMLPDMTGAPGGIS